MKTIANSILMHQEAHPFS